MVKYKKLEELKVKIFADGADFENIKLLADQTLIKGFTTNPSLMRKSGISDYAGSYVAIRASTQSTALRFIHHKRRSNLS